MALFDKTDKKILLELDTNARLSQSQIAKKTGLGKNNVQYRISKLLERGIIKKFVTQPSLSKLGLLLGKIYLRMSGFTEAEEKSLYDYLMLEKKISWVAKTEGHWDLMIGAYVRSLIQFAKIKKDFFAKFESFITDYDVVFLIEGHTSQRTYLLDKKKQLPITVEKFMDSSVETVKDEDITLMKLIANDARFNYIDLSNKLELNVKTVRKRISELEQKGIIQGYVTFVDTRKLGFNFFKLCVYLKDYHKSLESFIRYCLGLPNVIHVIESLGPWEIELEIETQTIEEFHKLTHEIRNKHADIIKKTESVIISDEKKLDFFPEWI